MTQKAPHILIIDDDKEIINLVNKYLCQNGYKVTCAYDGLTLSRLLQENNFDLIILDVMLPGKDGLSLCVEIRQVSTVPIIILSAAQSEGDRVSGLELGADDYMVKPFSSRELLARIKAHLRRTTGVLQPATTKIQSLAKLQFSQWILDKEMRSLVGADKVVIALSRREYDLLLILLDNPNRVLSRSQLMDHLYDKDCDPFDRSIDVLIGRIRKKIEQDPKKPVLLKTIRGGGYQLTTQVKKLQ